jgi:putative membrane protein
LHYYQVNHFNLKVCRARHPKLSDPPVTGRRAAGGVLQSLHFLTPFDEVLLIRQGNLAAALSLGGALIGFSITIGSALVHTADYREFFMWAFGAMVVQMLAYAVTTRLLNMSKDQIEANNAAFGGLLGAISISIGVINGACIS